MKEARGLDQKAGGMDLVRLLLVCLATLTTDRSNQTYFNLQALVFVPGLHSFDYRYNLGSLDYSSKAAYGELMCVYLLGAFRFKLFSEQLEMTEQNCNSFCRKTQVLKISLKIFFRIKFSRLKIIRQ